MNSPATPRSIPTSGAALTPTWFARAATRHTLIARRARHAEHSQPPLGTQRPVSSSRLRFAAIALVICLSPHGYAATTGADAAASNGGQAGFPSGTWIWSARVGAAAFIHARSLALPHNVQPSLHVAADHEIVHRLQVGVGGSAVVTNDSNYGVWAGYLRGRSVLYRSPALQWGVTVGVGAGHNPPIIHGDLEADLPVVPYAMLATDLDWRLGRSAWLGLELAGEQLSVVHLGALLRWQ